MGVSFARRVGTIIGLGVTLVSCGSSKQTTPGGEPAPLTCEPGVTRCEDKRLKTCNEDGTAETVGEACGGDALDEVCEPGVTRCEASTVRACNQDGTKETTLQVCALGQVCSNGACREAEKACLPSSKFCNQGAIWKCDSSGASSTVVERCTSGLFCRAVDDEVVCAAQACSVGDALCEGNVATTCASDGSGPKPGGTDCSQSKQACYKGVCRDIACAPGTKLCQHDDVYLCGQNGTETSLFADCQAGEVCDADVGSCRPRLCEPGKPTCDGTRAVTCNGFGSAWLADSKDCAAEGKVCASGGCKTRTCSPNTSFCQDGAVYSCDSSGTAPWLSATCNPQYEHCEAYSGGTYAYCRYNDCVAGQTLCSGNVIKTCDADGSLPAGGVACASNQYCDSASVECKDLTCTPGELLCQSGDVYYCDWNGPYLNATCEDGSACKSVTAGFAACSPLACSADAVACLGNKIGTCAADGQSLGSVSSDCAEAGNVCTVEPKCAPSAVDTLGVAENLETLYAGTLVANAIEVTSARKLTELQLNLVLPAPRELRWVFYEQSGSTFIAKYDAVVSAPSSVGFVSSGPLNQQLKVGKRYLLGVVISGGDCADYIDTVPFSQPISFGTLLGRVTSNYWNNISASSIDSFYASQMKVTTEAP
jgi:hypothetical protein